MGGGNKSMNFMTCTTCQTVVQQNDIGVCLGCQRGFVGVPQEDVYEPEKSVEELESVSTCDKAKDGKKVGGRNAKKRKKPKKKGKKEIT